jgi:hypothetical protein
LLRRVRSGGAVFPGAESKRGGLRAVGERGLVRAAGAQDGAQSLPAGGLEGCAGVGRGAQAGEPSVAQREPVEQHRGVLAQQLPAHAVAVVAGSDLATAAV